MQADGTFTYVATAGYVGTDGFTYTAGDGATVSNTATVTINVTDQAPSVADQSYTLFQNNTLMADGTTNATLLDNASDPDGDSLCVDSVNGVAANVGQTITLASGASLTVQADGTFVYTPTSTYLGTDTFTYTVNDGASISTPATVSIIVSCQAPTAEDTSYSVLHDQTLSVDDDLYPSLLESVTDPQGDPLTIATVNGDPANVDQTITLPSGASLTVQDDGTFDYTPVAGFVGTDSFSYTATNGNATSNTATVSIDVTLTAITADDVTYGVLYNQTLTADGTTIAGLIDNGDSDNTPPTVATVNGSADAVGQSITLASGASLTVQSDGTFSYTPPAGYLGSDSFTYTTTDGEDFSNTATVTLNVVTQAISVTPPTYSTPHDQQLFADAGDNPTLLDDASDVTGATLSITSVNGNAANVGQAVILASGGSVTVQSDGSFVYTPAAGYVGSDSFTFTAGDSNGDSSPTIATISVTDTAPVAVADSYSVPHDQTLVGDDNANPSLLTNDSDADDDTLSVTSINGSAANVGQAITLTSGAQLSVQADGTFTYVAAAGYVGSDSFTYTASDGAMTSNTAMVNIAVTDTTPVVAAANYTVAHGQTLSIDGSADNALLSLDDSLTEQIVSVNGSAANVGQPITLASGSCLDHAGRWRVHLHTRKHVCWRGFVHGDGWRWHTGVGTGDHHHCGDRQRTHRQRGDLLGRWRLGIERRWDQHTLAAGRCHFSG